MAYLTEVRLRVSLGGRFCCPRALVENDAHCLVVSIAGPSVGLIDSVVTSGGLS
jgi:hypothetical protein